MARGLDKSSALVIVTLWMALSMALAAIACAQSGSESGSRTLETSRTGRHATGEASSLVIDIPAIRGAHNRVRDEVGVAALEWSPEIAASAQRWADRLAATDSLEHSSGPYGENLWSGTAGAFSQAEMVESWANEKRSFSPGKVFPKGCRRDFRECGHYTQIVWRGTLRLGCGRARSHNTDYLVCQYDPPGNVVGENPY